MGVCACASVFVCVYIYMYTHAVCLFVCLSVRMYACMYVCLKPYPRLCREPYGDSESQSSPALKMPSPSDPQDAEALV